MDGEGRTYRQIALGGEFSPVIWQNFWLITRPSPVPPYLRVVEASACENASNTFSIWSGVMPIPVSLTRKRIQSLPATVSRTTSSEVLPFSVNLQALLSRLTRLCRILYSCKFTYLIFVQRSGGSIDLPRANYPSGSAAPDRLKRVEIAAVDLWDPYHDSPPLFWRISDSPKKGQNEPIVVIFRAKGSPTRLVTF